MVAVYSSAGRIKEYKSELLILQKCTYKIIYLTLRNILQLYCTKGIGGVFIHDNK